MYANDMTKQIHGLIRRENRKPVKTVHKLRWRREAS
jgi:hypothetical protein